MAGAAFGALGHADHQDAVHPQVGERGIGLRELAGAAVDQQHVGQHRIGLALALRRAAEAALDRLAHRRVVVARLDVADVVAPVLAAHRAAGVEHHARGHGGLAHGVADVETLRAPDRLGQPQHLAQGLAARVLRVAAGQLGDQRGLRVAAGQFQIAGALAAHVPAQLHLALGSRTQRRFDQFGVGNFAIQQDLARRRVLGVVLRHERAEHLGRAVLAVGLGEERAGAEIAPVAERQQQHAGIGALGGAGEHVQVGGAAVHVLAALHAAQRAEQVAQARCAFELQLFAGGLHRLHQFLAELVAAPVQKHRRAAHRLGVLVGRHQRHARRAAAADLVLQARPRAVAEHAVLAAAQLEQLVH